MNRRNLTVTSALLAGAFALAGVFVLVGCASKVRYPSYYVLDVPPRIAAPAQPSPNLVSVAVREFRAPAYLTGGSIVYHSSPEQIGFYDFHHWAEDPRRAVTAAMIRQLQASGIFQSVNLFDGHSSAEYVLTGTLDRLEEVDKGGSVSTEVGLSARLTNAATGVVVWQGTSLETAHVEQRSVSGVVAEMSNELGVVVERLVSSIESRVSSAPPLVGRSSVPE